MLNIRCLIFNEIESSLTCLLLISLSVVHFLLAPKVYRQIHLIILLLKKRWQDCYILLGLIPNSFKPFPHGPKYIVHIPHTNTFTISESTISLCFSHISASTWPNSYSPSRPGYFMMLPGHSHLCHYCTQSPPPLYMVLTLCIYQSVSPTGPWDPGEQVQWCTQTGLPSA